MLKAELPCERPPPTKVETTLKLLKPWSDITYSRIWASIKILTFIGVKLDFYMSKTQDYNSRKNTSQPMSR